jgi:hypothetical protein
VKATHSIALALACVTFLVGGVLLGWSAKSLLAREDASPPNRPANIPKSALWAGGPDGGVWIDCAVPLKGVFKCGVYAQQTGAVLEEGDFGLESGELTPAFYSNGLIALKYVRLVRSP